MSKIAEFCQNCILLKNYGGEYFHLMFKTNIIHIPIMTFKSEIVFED
jgi:hypothetical protein